MLGLLQVIDEVRLCLGDLLGNLPRGFIEESLMPSARTVRESAARLAGRGPCAGKGDRVAWRM